MSHTAKRVPRLTTESIVVPRFGSAMPYSAEFNRFVDGACFVFGSVNSSIMPRGLPYFAHMASLNANAVAKCRRHATTTMSLSGRE